MNASEGMHDDEQPIQGTVVPGSGAADSPAAEDSDVLILVPDDDAADSGTEFHSGSSAQDDGAVENDSVEDDPDALVADSDMDPAGETDGTTDEPAAETMPESSAETFPEPGGNAFPEPGGNAFPEPGGNAFPEPGGNAFPGDADDAFPEPAGDSFPERASDAFPAQATGIVSEPAAETVPDPAAEAVPEPAMGIVSEPAAETVPPGASPAESTASGSLTTSPDQRWSDIQVMFVDDPRGSVERAADLARETLREVTTMLEEQEQSLRSGWEKTGADTEDLRTSLQAYRALVDRVTEFAKQP